MEKENIAKNVTRLISFANNPYQCCVISQMFELRTYFETLRNMDIVILSNH